MFSRSYAPVSVMTNASRTPRTELYPEIEPYSAGMLKLDAVHTMYWEQ